MTNDPRPRLRDFGIAPGHFPTGPLNAITDVEGVAVGHVTLMEGDTIRTGATAILPHQGNLHTDKVPAGFAVYNGYGKFAGSTQIEELGELESPILLTNTLAVGRAIEAINRWTLAQLGNEKVTSINAVVGETNDSRLNDIRVGRPTVEELSLALHQAQAGIAIEEGGVGAGTGTVAFGYKGGIGTSSRKVKTGDQMFTVGVLVQSNYGGSLRIDGRPLTLAEHDKDGSIVMIVATDAPLDSRNLQRLATRTFAGLARTGSAMSNGSGDYALAFSTSLDCRRTPERRRSISLQPSLPNERISPLFEAVIEATEEAILCSLVAAQRVDGFNAASGKPSSFDALPHTALTTHK